MSSCHRVMYYDRTVKVLVTSSALTRAGMYPGKGGPPASQRLRLSIRPHAGQIIFYFVRLEVDGLRSRS
jgi:hypothetical protein